MQLASPALQVNGALLAVAATGAGGGAGGGAGAGIPQSQGFALATGRG